MPNHDNASNESQGLCQNLLKELRKYNSDVTLNESKDTCAVFVEGRNRFAYVYHRSKGEFIRVYFRGDISVAPALQKELSITINIRPKIEKGWDKEFPYFMEIDSNEQILVAAKIVYLNAYPLSEKKSRKKEHTEHVAIPEELPKNISTTSFFEGSAKTISVNIYERNPIARKICIAHYKCTCQICKFDFESVYGDLGRGIIHVHHILPLSQIGEGYRVDPLSDLIPVCPNCHAVIHRKNPHLSVDVLKNAVKHRS